MCLRTGAVICDSSSQHRLSFLEVLASWGISGHSEMFSKVSDLLIFLVEPRNGVRQKSILLLYIC